MVYDPNNAIERPTLSKNKMHTGVVLTIQDGKIRDFVTDGALEQFKGKEDQTAINVLVEVIENNRSHQFWQMFTYNTVEGVTEYSQNSNLGKFKRRYQNLPAISTKVDVMVDSKGFSKIVLD